MSFPLDSNGYILNTGSIESIQPEFQPLLDSICRCCKEHLESSITSIYVRGSISAGRAYPYSSDADVVVLTNKAMQDSELDWRTPTVDALLQEYPIVTDIDLTIVSVDQLLCAKEYSRLRVYLATQSALLVAEEITNKLPRFKPNRESALYMYPNITAEFSQLRQIFTGESRQLTYLRRERPMSFWCIWTMRTVLRSAQALTMATEGTYECELRACLENSANAYPVLKEYLEQAYAWALHPTSNGDSVVEFLDHYLPLFLELWQSQLIAPDTREVK